MTSEKLKPTPGPWLFGDWSNNKLGEVDEAGWADVWAQLSGGTRSLPFVSCKHQQEIENARLIAEAGTVFHECGLSPRELLEAVRELRESLQMAEQKLVELENHHGGGDDEIYIEGAILTARAALAKHKEV